MIPRDRTSPHWNVEEFLAHGFLSVPLETSLHKVLPKLSFGNLKPFFRVERLQVWGLFPQHLVLVPEEILILKLLITLPIWLIISSGKLR